MLFQTLCLFWFSSYFFFSLVLSFPVCRKSRFTFAHVAKCSCFLLSTWVMVVFLQKVAKTSRQIGAFSQEISALTVSAVTSCTTVCGVLFTVRPFPQTFAVGRFSREKSSINAFIKTSELIFDEELYLQMLCQVSRSTVRGLVDCHLIKVLSCRIFKQVLHLVCMHIVLARLDATCLGGMYCPCMNIGCYCAVCGQYSTCSGFLKQCFTSRNIEVRNLN